MPSIPEASLSLLAAEQPASSTDKMVFMILAFTVLAALIHYASPMRLTRVLVAALAAMETTYLEALDAGLLSPVDVHTVEILSSLQIKVSKIREASLRNSLSWCGALRELFNGHTFNVFQCIWEFLFGDAAPAIVASIPGGQRSLNETEKEKECDVHLVTTDGMLLVFSRASPSTTTLSDADAGDTVKAEDVRWDVSHVDADVDGAREVMYHALRKEGIEFAEGDMRFRRVAPSIPATGTAEEKNDKEAAMPVDDAGEETKTNTEWGARMGVSFGYG
ncbi:hypothetical protein B0H19DRAFT_1061263 [Mycena capillaripes]|nr:hypothetical protein B0H19DRAFT_1061263 [Mycena capillaripes]